jgi:hypothetical protein
MERGVALFGVVVFKTMSKAFHKTIEGNKITLK